MKRNLLISALGNAASDRGYDFICAHSIGIAAKMPSVPAAWLTPPKLISVQGRVERRDTYRISLRLLNKSIVMGGGSLNEALDVMEQDADNIISALRDAVNVRRVFGVKYVPEQDVWTRNGGHALLVEFDVELFYILNS